MKKYKNHIITFGIGLVFSIIYICLRDITSCTSAQDVYKILSDAFFIPGFLIFGLGLLVFTANEGVFDMLKYGISRIFNAAKKDEDIKYKTYYEYVKASHEKDGKFSHLLIAGLIQILISVLFLILFMS